MMTRQTVHLVRAMIGLVDLFLQRRAGEVDLAKLELKGDHELVCLT
jgi:hypothetical protein